MGFKKQANKFADIFAKAYSAFRISIWYPLGLTLGSALYLLLNSIFGFDAGSVIFLAFISVEASVATSLNSRDLAHLEKYMLHLLEAIVQKLEDKE